MIENQAQLKAAIQAIDHLYLALASLRERFLPVNPRQYELFAEGPVDEISKLQASINAYLGISPAHALSDPVLREAPPQYDPTKDRD